jgi:hypothetical protein
MGLFDKTTDMLGHPLAPETRKRILRFMETPSDETWDDIHGIILNGTIGLGRTLWQAVRLLDPTFPNSKRDKWERIPDPMTVARAIRRAANEKPIKRTNWSRR